MKKQIAWCLILALTGSGAWAQSGESKPKKPDANAGAKAGANPVKLPIKHREPFFRLFRKAGYVDLDAEVCLNDGFLEMLATTKGGKEHEAAFAIRAKPSELHVALLALGVKAGAPGRAVKQPDGTWKHLNPHGGQVRISVLYEKDKKLIEKPISWFVRSEKGKRLKDQVFLFAGSVIAKDGKGKPYYMADGDPNVITLVTFGNEVLTPPKYASNKNDQLVWKADPDRLPEIGTKVVVRIKKVDKASETKAPSKKDKGAEATESKPKVP